MTGRTGSRTPSQGRILTIATAVLVLSLPASLGLPAYGQQSPPDDAPAEAFPGGTPSPGQGSPSIRQPQQKAPPMIGGGIWLAKGPGPAIGGQVEAILPGPGEVIGAIHTVAAHPTDGPQGRQRPTPPPIRDIGPGPLDGLAPTCRRP